MYANEPARRSATAPARPNVSPVISFQDEPLFGFPLGPGYTTGAAGGSRGRVEETWVVAAGGGISAGGRKVPLGRNSSEAPTMPHPE